jgi:Flp pilus assembly pilin Flp
MNARDRSQVPGHAERARIVALISVQLAAAVLIIGQYVSSERFAAGCAV